MKGRGKVPIFSIIFLSIFFYACNSVFSANVVINEFVANPLSGEDWIELYNPSNFLVDLEGWILDDEGTVTNMYDFGSGEVIDPQDFLVIEVGNRLNKDGDTIYLKDDSDTVVDQVTYGSSAPVPNVGESTGRFPDGTDTDNDAEDFRLFKPSVVTNGSSNICPFYNVDRNECYGTGQEAVLYSDPSDTLTYLGIPIDIESIRPRPTDPPGISPTSYSISNDDITVGAEGIGDWEGMVVLFNYLKNPKENNPVFSEGSNFYEVFFKDMTLNADANNRITKLEITFQNPGGTKMYWWDKNTNSWEECSDQIQNPDGSITVTVTENTVPNLQDLEDPPFGGGNPPKPPTPTVQVPTLSPPLLAVLFLFLGLIGVFGSRE